MALASDIGVGLDVYSRQYIGAIVEVPSYLTMPIMADKIGRTRAWGALLAGTSVSLLLLAWLERSSDLANSNSSGGLSGGDSGGGAAGGGGGGGGGGGSAGVSVSAGAIALALLARFCIAGASSINYVAAAEQFPTSSRSVLTPLPLLLPPRVYPTPIRNPPRAFTPAG